ncbi:hypothetical protein WN55_11229 [Dufourea novaeangliae]|uniref:Uncharacterized protein n=1 Tax=Dufourea novaeangliae TaxID=178035 RepID=A0A154PB78_DUFNO|nr:hypothetical protein WN55_11229 [Dufourea novaeangliae]
MYPWYRDSVAAAAAAGLGGPVGVVGSGFCSTGPGQAGTTIKTESGYSDCMLALDYVQSKEFPNSQTSGGMGLRKPIDSEGRALLRRESQRKEGKKRRNTDPESETETDREERGGIVSAFLRLVERFDERLMPRTRSQGESARASRRSRRI